MKKQTKKLVLSTETLRDLERENLEFVVGATGPTNCATAVQKASCGGC